MPHRKQILTVSILMLLTSLFGLFSVIAAQSGSGSPVTIVRGLNSPRHLSFDFDGNLYIAESGTGGDFDIQGPFGPANAGGSAAIHRVETDGAESEFIIGLPSTDALNGEVLGASKVRVREDSIWLLLAQGSLDNPFSYSLVELSPENKRVLTHVDLYTYEVENNPDAGVIDSNPVDFAVSLDGVFYIVDAGANAVYTWSEAGGLALFAAWESNPVPTSVELGPDGSVYIGFLTGFPFPSGGAWVEQYDAEGELLETYEGFTAIVDLLFANHTLYAVEIGQFGEQGWVQNTGRVVDVFSGEAYYSNLPFPYGLAANSNENLFLTTYSSFSGHGSGQVLSLDGVDLNGAVVTPPPPQPTLDTTEEPTGTPEVTAEPTEESTQEVTAEPTEDLTPTDELEPTQEPTGEVTPTDEVEPTVEVTATEPPVETVEPTEDPGM